MMIAESNEHPPTNEMRALDLPAAVRLEIDNFLMGCSSPLILDGILAGSGTFVRCGNVRGILTAHHVVHNPKSRDRVFDFSLESKQDLTLPIVTGRKHKFSIPMRLVECVDIGVPDRKDDYLGPDLSFLILPEVDATTIGRDKLFLNIAKDRENRISSCEAPDGVWCTVGFPQYLERSHESSDSSTNVIYIPSLTVYTHITYRENKTGFDFLHLNVEHSHMIGNVSAPHSYGGMSGAGVWKIPLSREVGRSTLTALLQKALLAGVVFYETYRQDKPDELRCHLPALFPILGQ